MYPAVIVILLALCGSGHHFTASARAEALKSNASLVRQDGDVRALEIAEPIKRKADGNATHLYRVSLAAGQYFRAVVDQQGVDVAVTLLGPGGQPLIKADGPSGSNGPEPISLIAEEAGEYRIEVRLPDKKPIAGEYVIRMEAQRSPTEADKDRVAAENLFWEANQLRKQPAIEARRKAIEKYEQAMAVFRGLNDRALEYYSSLVVGFIHHSSGEPEKALEYYSQALTLCKSLGNRTDEPILLNNIGGVYDTLGEPHKALEYYGNALALWSTRNERGQQGDTLNNVGTIYFKLGEPQKALDYYNQSLTLKRELGNPIKISNTLSNIALVYTIVGEQGRALEYLKEALDLHHAAKDVRGEAISHYHIAYAHASLGDMTKALEHYNQALLLHRTTGNKRGESITLDSIGVATYSLGERQKALEYHQQALELQRATKDRRSEAITLEHIGYVYALSGELERAAQYYKDALSLAQAVGDRREEANVLQGMAHVERKRGDFIAARKRIEEAISKNEAVRGELDLQLRASYFGVEHDAYQFYIDLLMHMHRLNPSEGHDATALKISEQARARSLLDILSEARIDIRQGVDGGLLARERELSQQINAKAARLIQALGQQNAKERAASLNKEISELEEQYRQAQAAIRKASPQYAALTQPQPLTAGEIQQLLDDETLLLEYSIGDERSYLWTVTKGSIKSYELPKREVIKKAARQVYDLLTARSLRAKEETAAQRRERVAKADDQLPQAAAELSAMVIAPAAAELRGRRLVIVPDGELHYIPFAILPAPQGSSVSGHSSPGNVETASGKRIGANKSYSPLIADHEIISLPSASAFAEHRKSLAGREPAERAIAVIADPVFSNADERFKTQAASDLKQATEGQDSTAATRILEHAEDSSAGVIPRLPFTRQEAEMILSIAPSQSNLKALGFQASRATATNPELAKYRYVHFATHGYLNTERAIRSGLVLSMVDERGKPQAGLLTLNEIFELKLPAELVVLSACETGLGKEFRGEGLWGMTRGFMYAGAARVVVSLWNVNDKATSELMARFYKAMLKDKQRPAAALRAAQVEMWRQKQWQQPYYWAAFTLQGEWR